MQEKHDYLPTWRQYSPKIMIHNQGQVNIAEQQVNQSG